jgi:hypothetical protein
MPIIEDPRKRAEILDLLTHAYWMEIETVMNYISHSVNLDGVRAEEIKKSLAADVTAEIGHAQLFARRIKTLSGLVPGSFSFRPQQATLQPNGNTTDVVSVIGGASTPSAARSSTLHPDHQGVRRHRLRHAGHGHPGAGRRAESPARVRGLPEGVRRPAAGLDRVTLSAPEQNADASGPTGVPYLIAGEASGRCRAGEYTLLSSAAC